MPGGVFGRSKVDRRDVVTDQHTYVDDGQLGWRRLYLSLENMDFLGGLNQSPAPLTQGRD